jgi:hypothetical protein
MHSLDLDRLTDGPAAATDGDDDGNDNAIDSTHTTSGRRILIAEIANPESISRGQQDDCMHANECGYY